VREKFEKLVRTTSGTVEVHCPNCDADKVERQVSLFGFAGPLPADLSGPPPTAAPSVVEGSDRKP